MTCHRLVDGLHTAIQVLTFSYPGGPTTEIRACKHGMVADADVNHWNLMVLPR